MALISAQTLKTEARHDKVLPMSTSREDAHRALAPLRQRSLSTRPQQMAQNVVISSAALVHGLRVALTFDNVDHIRSEIRQETRRVRRARKAETKAALKFYREHGPGAGALE
jgi:hypothetical protein